jgi:hypothetical protein
MDVPTVDGYLFEGETERLHLPKKSDLFYVGEVIQFISISQ